MMRNFPFILCFRRPNHFAIVVIICQPPPIGQWSMVHHARKEAKGKEVGACPATTNIIALLAFEHLDGSSSSSASAGSLPAHNHNLY
jgi:hypothetical protein